MDQWFTHRRYSWPYKHESNTLSEEYLSEVVVAKEETPARWNRKLTAARSASAPTL